ncbi:MAG: cytochrome b [Hyphomonadaceae bacterium]
MSAGNTANGYGWVAIILHWLAAIGLITMIAIGWAAEAAGEAGDRAGRAELMALHFSVGATFSLIFLTRIVAHYAQRQPNLPAQAKPLNLLAKATHHLLLLALLIMVVSGPTQVLAGGRDIIVWNTFTIATPFAAENEAVRNAAHTLHGIGRAALYVLIPLHILGALKHMLMDDGFLRMLMPARD